MLERIFEPLVEIMLSTGVTVYEAYQLIRYIAAKQAETMVKLESGRNNHSRVAAITGLSRTEVSRLLMSARPTYKSKRLSSLPLQRVIDTWLSSPSLLTPTGEPGEIPIFGGSKSFAAVVRRSSSGIPTRAMLDELLRSGCAELRDDSFVRLTSNVVVTRGLTSGSLTAIGERVSSHLRTMASNLDATNSPLLESTEGGIEVSSALIPLIRREVTSRSATYMTSIRSLLARATQNSSRGRSFRTAASNVSVGVGVYYFEDAKPAASNTPVKAIPRRNLSRRRQAARPKSNITKR